MPLSPGCVRCSGSPLRSCNKNCKINALATRSKSVLNLLYFSKWRTQTTRRQRHGSPLGQFSYTGDYGIPIRLTYTVEENGFVARGAHLPTTLPVPVTIQRTLQYLALRYQTENCVLQEALFVAANENCNINALATRSKSVLNLLYFFKWSTRYTSYIYVVTAIHRHLLDSTWWALAFLRSFAHSSLSRTTFLIHCSVVLGRSVRYLLP